MQPFNILHVITKLPVGGVENMLLKVVRGYDTEMFKATVCCIKQGGEIADALNEMGYRVLVLDKMNRHGFGFDVINTLYQILRQEDVHILRTHQYHANLYGRIAGILARVPVIIPSFHNLYVSPDKPKLHRRIINKLLSYFSDKLVAVSETIKSDIHSYDRINSEKITVIHNGIEINQLNNTLSRKEARSIFNLSQDSLIIGSVGRLTEQKGHRFLIDAVSNIADVQIAIAGDGPLKGDLMERAKINSVKCTFAGQLHNSDIPKFLKALDIFCFPSLWEGMPSALVEAMASGLPIVASDIPPHREIINGSGVLTKTGDSSDLARAFERLIRDASFADTLGSTARERAKIFSIEISVNKYEQLFKDILRKKNLL